MYNGLLRGVGLLRRSRGILQYGYIGREHVHQRPSTKAEYGTLLSTQLRRHNLRDPLMTTVHWYIEACLNEAIDDTPVWDINIIKNRLNLHLDEPTLTVNISIKPPIILTKPLFCTIPRVVLCISTPTPSWWCPCWCFNSLIYHLRSIHCFGRDCSLRGLNQRTSIFNL